MPIIPRHYYLSNPETEDYELESRRQRCFYNYGIKSSPFHMDREKTHIAEQDRWEGKKKKKVGVWW